MSRRGELREQEKACCILDMDRNPELLEENSECPLRSQVSRAGARSHKSPDAHSKLLKTNVKLFVRSNFVSALVIDEQNQVIIQGNHLLGTLCIDMFRLDMG